MNLHSNSIIQTTSNEVKANKFLNTSITIWFIAAIVGQFIFAMYIVTDYVLPLGYGDFQKWNKNLPHGYTQGNTIGNIVVGIHLFFAAVITLGGPIQFIPRIRNRFPVFHKWNGRLYVFTVLLMSLSGLYLHFSGRKLVGDTVQFIAFEIAALLMIVFAVLAVRNAMIGNIKVHSRWAFRLFLLVSGGWFYRVGLMFWLSINGGPVGFDFETFSGPFLTILSYSMHMGLVPLLVYELYLHAKEKGTGFNKKVIAVLLITLTIIMIIGVIASTMGMWFA